MRVVLLLSLLLLFAWVAHVDARKWADIKGTDHSMCFPIRRRPTHNPFCRWETPDALPAGVWGAFISMQCLRLWFPGALSVTLVEDFPVFTAGVGQRRLLKLHTH
jgi:hypothetical protein